jgi:hypothetical protein
MIQGEKNPQLWELWREKIVFKGLTCYEKFCRWSIYIDVYTLSNFLSCYMFHHYFMGVDVTCWVKMCLGSWCDSTSLSYLCIRSWFCLLLRDQIHGSCGWVFVVAKLASIMINGFPKKEVEMCWSLMTYRLNLIK